MSSWCVCAVAAIGVLGSLSCSLQTSKSGQACLRSTQCEPGLACVSGNCSKDLSSIAAHDTVPTLKAGAGGHASAAGGGAGESGAGVAGAAAASGSGQAGP